MDKTSQDGYLKPFLSAGMLLLRPGNMFARDANIKHHDETDANCIIVSVTGCGKALRIDFDEVFVNADVIYQTIQSVYDSQHLNHFCKMFTLTINL